MRVAQGDSEETITQAEETKAEIIYKNPLLVYEFGQTIQQNRNEGSSVDKATRILDGARFVVKHMDTREVEKLSDEFILYNAINSDFVMRPDAIYRFKERLFIIFEEMNGGSLNLILPGLQSEEYCKYTLYCAAMGIKAMHL